MTPDVNVLIAASRNDHPYYDAAREWLEAALDDAAAGRGLLLLPMVIASFLRLVTHPKIFVSPTPIAEAVNFIDVLLTAPGVRMPEIGAEWHKLRESCLTRKLRANDIPDAWLAATVQQMGDHLASFDADFRKLLKRSEFTWLKRLGTLESLPELRYRAQAE
ncbi:MAG: PIN domain-containing protein [Gammaproteobacteria bacterium]|nr:PIN domain-containing protein [Gammaproteobacteria bacterium]